MNDAHDRAFDAREARLFLALAHGTGGDPRRGTVSPAEVLEIFSEVGLSKHDFRLREAVSALEARGDAPLSFDEFREAVRPNILLVERALQGNMVIADFAKFSSQIGEIYRSAEAVTSGKVADYIPSLKNVDPRFWGVSVCTVDGQRFSIGDSKKRFSIQSCSKPIVYALALEEHGAEEVHRYVGREPSGRRFNEVVWDDRMRPHNPLINAGSIVCCSLVKPQEELHERLSHVLEKCKELTGGDHPEHPNPNFDPAVAMGEEATGWKNFALANLIMSNRKFPAHVRKRQHVEEVLDLYFHCCALEMNTDMMSVVAATLANGGVCPTSGQRVLQPRTVQHCLSLIYSCGMYDYSGEFAFSMGIPAKSGVGGGLLIVIPNVLGIATWSPRLDEIGNSARGIEFCRQLIQRFKFHIYDNLDPLSSKVDPRLDPVRSEAALVNELIWAASKGDLSAIERLVTRGGKELLRSADYDRRTPLHLAAAENRVNVVRFFVQNGADLNPEDRWGGTPLDDAKQNAHAEVAALLEQHGARAGSGGWATLRAQPGKPTTSGPPSDDAVELIWAASKASLRTVQRFVARGVPLDLSDYDHRTPLHLAACEGHEEVVEYLLDRGVALEPRDRWGRTPEDDARRYGHARIVGLLEAARVKLSR